MASAAASAAASARKPSEGIAKNGRFFGLYRSLLASKIIARPASPTASSAVAPRRASGAPHDLPSVE